MIPIKLHTENFDGEAKKVGEVTIGNETIPVFEFSVKPKSDEDLFNFAMLNKDFSKYEQEFLDLAQKLRGEIETQTSLFFALTYSEINRYLFRDVKHWGDDNPVKGFLQAWGGEEKWLTWIESPAVADRREKDDAFLTAFQKWALAKFLQLVFEDRMLPSPVPRFGSEEERGFGNGKVSVGKLGVFCWSTKNSTETNLPDDDGNFYFWDIARLRNEELERLYEFLMGRLKDFYDIYKK